MRILQSGYQLGVTIYVIKDNEVIEGRIVAIEQRINKPTKYWYANEKTHSEWFFTEQNTENIYMSWDVAQHVLDKRIVADIKRRQSEEFKR